MDLATGWSVKRVIEALVSEERSEGRIELTDFLQVRYDQRFFEPISLLEKEATRKPSSRPYGFAIMSLACQMVETLESYIQGVPTTNVGDLKKIQGDPRYKYSPKQLECDNSKKLETKEAFKAFFSEYKKWFPGLDGEDFYYNVRNSLLHQSQTRNGWVIKVHKSGQALTETNEVLVSKKKILYRDCFVSQLHGCFKSYIKNLREHTNENSLWKNPERKIWWIAWLSDPQYLIEWVNNNPAHFRSNAQSEGGTRGN
jgi:hypothetical protein